MGRLVSDREGETVVRVGRASTLGEACNDAGRSERGVAWTVLPACMQAIEREKSNKKTN